MKFFTNECVVGAVVEILEQYGYVSTRVLGKYTVCTIPGIKVRMLQKHTLNDASQGWVVLEWGEKSRTIRPDDLRVLLQPHIRKMVGIVLPRKPVTKESGWKAGTCRW